jgi:hypothetical protein
MLHMKSITYQELSSVLVTYKKEDNSVETLPFNILLPVLHKTKTYNYWHDQHNYGLSVVHLSI